MTVTTVAEALSMAVAATQIGDHEEAKTWRQFAQEIRERKMVQGAGAQSGELPRPDTDADEEMEKRLRAALVKSEKRPPGFCNMCGDELVYKGERYCRSCRTDEDLMYE